MRATKTESETQRGGVVSWILEAGSLCLSSMEGCHLHLSIRVILRLFSKECKPQYFHSIPSGGLEIEDLLNDWN